MLFYSNSIEETSKNNNVQLVINRDLVWREEIKVDSSFWNSDHQKPDSYK